MSARMYTKSVLFSTRNLVLRRQGQCSAHKRPIVTTATTHVGPVLEQSITTLMIERMIRFPGIASAPGASSTKFLGDGQSLGQSRV